MILKYFFTTQRPQSSNCY